MSFELLEKEIINVGLCQGCALCAGLCKHIEMEATRPILKDYCILEREGKDCGKCYQSCPQVNQKIFETKEPLGIYSLRSKDDCLLRITSPYHHGQETLHSTVGKFLSNLHHQIP